MFLLITIPSSTVFSQITGLSREQKVKIVSTLQDYPLVVEELEITKELLYVSKVLNQHLDERNSTLAKQNSILKDKNNLTEKQLEIYRMQQKATKSSTGEKLLYFGSGVGLGALSVFILTLL